MSKEESIKKATAIIEALEVFKKNYSVLMEEDSLETMETTERLLEKFWKAGIKDDEINAVLKIVGML